MNDADISATVDLVESISGSESSLAEDKARDGFLHGATWTLEKVAAWLEATNIVAQDALAQRTVDDTKLLIADQARQAAAALRTRK